jgi:hypothetical protein
MKNVSILLALLVLLAPTALQHSHAQTPGEVESGWRGLIDVGTNIRNLFSLGRSALSDLAHLDIRGAMETMRGFPDNAGQTAGLYLFAVSFILSIVSSFCLSSISIIPLIRYLGLLVTIPPLLLGLGSGYLIYSNSAGPLHWSGLLSLIMSAVGGSVSIISYIPLIGILLAIPALIITVPMTLTGVLNLGLQIVLIALGRGGSAPGEPVIDRFITLTVPLEVTEGEEFLVSATLEGKPLSNALITLENETVITDSYGMTTLRAPDVAEDTSYLIEAGGTEGKGSTTILVKNSPGLFEVGQEGSSWLTAIILIIALAVVLVLLSRRRGNA